MIDRRQFTPDGSNPDVPVPFGDYQTVPTERMAYLLAGLLECDGKSVLEIGTGSGYQTAVLAERAREVVSIESRPVAGIAQKLPANAYLIEGDGLTLDTGQLYDRILVTCATSSIRPVWYEQLKDGGRLVIPLHVGGLCQIAVYDKRDGILILNEIAAYAPFTEADEAN